MRISTSDRPSRSSRLRQALLEEARQAGFDAVAVTTPDAIPLAAERLRAFVAQGLHGSMAWMEETLARRSDPRALWPEVRSIVVMAMNYGPDGDPRALRDEPDRGVISVHARNRDYHEVMKGRLKGIAGRIASSYGGDVKVFVDTAPVMEKPLAEAAGLGWQGKHSNLVSREFGSWLFLGSIFTTEEIDPDRPQEDRCGSCRACLDACPTGHSCPPTASMRGAAFPTSRSRTRDDPAGVPRGDRQPHLWLRRLLAACPWNKFARAASEAKLQARDELREPLLADLLGLDDAAFRSLFFRLAGQAHRPRPLPAQRARRGRQFGRRAACASLPAADSRFLAAGTRRRSLGVLAAGRPGRDGGRRRTGAACETDSQVRAEWQLAVAARRGAAA